MNTDTIKCPECEKRKQEDKVWFEKERRFWKMLGLGAFFGFIIAIIIIILIKIL